MTLRQTVVDSITANSQCLFPGVTQDAVRIERLLQQWRWGLNITYSARFLCSVTVPGSNAVAKRLFVKCKGEVEREYENMRLLWDLHYCRSRDYLIPRPFFLDRTNHLLFLEQIDGDGFLGGFYPRLSGRLNLLETRVAALANWLVDFQNIYRSTEDHTTPPELLNYRINVQKLHGLSDLERRRVIEKIAKAIRDFPPYQETFVMRQFLPRNVMFTKSESRVCMVDFPKLTKGWPLFDFLSFLLALEKLQLYPLISRDKCDHLKSVFTSEYLAKNNLRYDRDLLDSFWAGYVIADLGRLYQAYKGLRIKGLGNNYFAYKIVRRLADWSRR